MANKIFYKQLIVVDYSCLKVATRHTYILAAKYKFLYSE